jgi:glycosyltransferase involved in cell wall biosynthesis
MEEVYRRKLAIIGTNGLPGRYGGWDQLLNHMTALLSSKYDIVVYTSKYNAVPGLKRYNNAKLIVLPLKANGVQSIFYDGISLIHASFKYDVLLVLGTSGGIFIPFVRLINSNILLNPDGAEWKRGKWNAIIKKYLKISEIFGVKYSRKVIADNQVIKNELFDSYKIDSTLIEYGGDHVLRRALTEEVAKRYNISSKGYAFKVCRIEPENNIDMILSAFIKTKYKLILIGNWANSAYGVNLKKKYSNNSNLVLLDPIYEQESLDELRSNCGLYIHGHSVGGTNPSLVEAMHLGLCCLVFGVNYNRETTSDSALYFHNEDELVDLVSNYQNGILNAEDIGRKLYSIARERYLWKRIINEYDLLF